MMMRASGTRSCAARGLREPSRLNLCPQLLALPHNPLHRTTRSTLCNTGSNQPWLYHAAGSGPRAPSQTSTTTTTPGQTPGQTTSERRRGVKHQSAATLASAGAERLKEAGVGLASESLSLQRRAWSQHRRRRFRACFAIC
eukprot:2504795-Rhodomonas_salina.2